jgi:L-amino acid N-acyltransferase YncA
MRFYPKSSEIVAKCRQWLEFATSAWRAGLGMMAGMRIRDAEAADWPQIWPFLREIIAAGQTYTWDVDTDEATARAKWMREPPGRTLVAVDDGQVVGTVEIHPNQAGPGAHVANAGFMVRPGSEGRGVGRGLAEQALEPARAAGFRAMQFNAVVETNVGAIALWESLGFDVIGRVPEAFAHPVKGYVDLLIMHRRL